MNLVDNLSHLDYLFEFGEIKLSQYLLLLFSFK